MTAALMVLVAARSSAPVTTRTNDTTTMPRTPKRSHRLLNCLARICRASGVLGAFAVMLMPAPPREPGRRWLALSHLPLLEPDPVAANDLVHDDDRQHDDALSDLHDADGHVRLDRQPIRLLVEEGEQHRSEDDADRLVAAKQRHRDPRESESGLEGRAVRVRRSVERRHPDQTRDGTGQQHAVENHPTHLDAGGDRGRLGHPRRAQVEAEARLVEHHPEPDAQEHGENRQSPDWPVGVRERIPPGEVAALGYRGRPHAVAEMLSVLVEQIAGQSDRDRVEHDRGDNLAHATGDLEQARDPRPRRAEHNREQDRDDDVEDAREDRRPCKRRGAVGGDPILSLDADVEEVHPEPDGRGEPRHVDQRRLVDHVDDQPVIRHREDDRQEVGGRAAGHGDQGAGDDHRDDDG